MDKFYEDELQRVTKEGETEWSELKYLPSDIYKIMKKPTWYLKDLL